MLCFCLFFLYVDTFITIINCINNAIILNDIYISVFEIPFDLIY